MASTGAWLCFESINRLRHPVLSVACQLLDTVSSALHNGQSTAMLQSNEVVLVSGWACFGTSHVSSTVADITKTARFQFRTTEFQTPQLKPIVEALLLKEGFAHCQVLASKLESLYNVSKEILVQDCLMAHYATPGLRGIGIATIRRAIGNAGNVKKDLGTLKGSSKREGMLENLDMTVNRDYHSSLSHDLQKRQGEKGEKETVLDMNETVDSSNNAAVGVTADDLIIEEQAVVIAVRDLMLPQLSGDDHKQFVTFLSAIFPSVDIWGLLETEWQTRSQIARQEMMFVASAAPSRTVTACSEDRPLANITEAIASAAAKLCLQPSISFHARVSQLGQLLDTYSTVWLIASYMHTQTVIV